MPTFKTVWQFVESNGSTFSEVWYKDGSQISLIVDPAGGAINTRLRFLHPLNTFVRVRVSQVGALRNTQNVSIGRVGQAANTLGPLAVGAAMVINVAGVGGGSKKLWMRGNDRADYVRDGVSGVDKASDGFKQVLTTFLNNLSAEGYGILRLTPIANPATSIAKVSVADGTLVPGQTVLTVNQNINPPVGGTVIISRTPPKDVPRLNGKYTVLAATATTITINYTTPGNAKINLTNGFVKVQLYDATHVIDPTRSAFDHLGTRTSRAPLFGSRGAKRAQRIRSLA